jgi:hypothetical protein
VFRKHCPSGRGRGFLGEKLQAAILKAEKNRPNLPVVGSD